MNRINTKGRWGSVKPSGPLQNACELHEPPSCACAQSDQGGSHNLFCDVLYNLLAAKIAQTQEETKTIKGIVKKKIESENACKIQKHGKTSKGPLSSPHWAGPKDPQVEISQGPRSTYSLWVGGVHEPFFYKKMTQN